jgi:cytochrome P450
MSSGGEEARAMKEVRLDEAVYRQFAERRRMAPVWPRSLAPGTGDGFTLYRYQDCARVLREPRTFSSRAYEHGIDMVMGRTILSMDDPDHKLHRDLVAHAFRQTALDAWAAEVLDSIVEELVDRFRARGRADLVAEFCGEFPFRVIARILGLPPEDFDRFRRWSMELIGVGQDPGRGLAASAALRDYFAAAVHGRRRFPRQDLINDLVDAEIGGQRLQDETIYSFLRLLLPAGIETTSRALPSLLYRLLQHPAQLGMVVDDRALVPRAIEEGLRFDAPVPFIARMAAADTSIRGVPIPAGSFLSLCLASANRDEERWTDPDCFDVMRPPKPHLTFAAGPHMCLGQHLARLELEVATNALIDQLPGLRLDPDVPAPALIWDGGLSMPALDSLPVRFEPD